MKLLRRVSALMLVFLMLLSLLPVSAFAASGQVVVQAGSVTGKPGDTVDVTISLTENPGIIGLNIRIGFDDTVLEIVDKGTNEYGEFLNPAYNNPFPKGELTTSESYNKNPITYLWMFPLSTVNLTQTGELMTVTFKIKENAKSGSSPITVVFTESPIDHENNAVAYASVNGSVTVADHTWGTPKYEWSKDYTTCTASVACSCCTNNAKSETVNSTKVDTPATCTTAQKTVYTAEFANALFAKQTKEVTGEAAKNHDWGSSTKYTWAADHSTCTAERTCQRTNCGLEDTETVTAEVTTNASSCYAEGSKKYTATFTKEGLETQTFEETMGVVGHTWGASTYSWSANYAECTAERSCTVNGCTGKETETVTAATQTTPATCEDAGETVYTADFVNAAFDTQTYTKPITKLGHNWGEVTYTWTTGYSACTAERTCARGCTDKETKASTCETVEAENNKPGSKTYTVDFENPDFMTQEKVETLTLDPAIYMSSATACVGKTVDVTVELMNNPGIAALELLVDYDDAVLELTGVADAELMGGYTGSETLTSDPYYLSWLENNGTKVYGKLATLTFKVKENAAVDATSVSVSVKSALNADMDDVAFNTTAGAVTVKAHEWSETTYTWSENYASNTAKRSCDCGAEETETVAATTQATPATCEDAGETVYTADFANAAFETQTYTKPITKLGHDWGTATYQWTDFSKCTASHECERTGCDATETEDGEITEQTNASSCFAAGTKVYTATFQKNGFTTQTQSKTLDIVGHAWGTVTYTWNEDNTACTAERVCTFDGCNAKENEEATATVVTTDATCTEDGKVVSTVTFNHENFDDQEVIKVLPKLGHSWVNLVYDWAEDFSACKASHKCERSDCGIAESEDGKITVTTENPGCEAPGKKTYTATFQKDGFTKQSKDKILAVVGHDMAPATCTEPATCKRDGCNHTEGKALGHKEETVPGKAATCTATGLTDGKKCTVCKEITVKQTEIKKLDHKLGEFKVTKEPTYTEKGVETAKCENCDHTEIREIPVKEAPKYDCAVSGHVWDEGKVTTEATCIKEGVKTYTCTVEGCTETKTEAIKALGHTVDEKVWESDATNHWHECTACGEKLDTAKHSGGTATTTAKAKCETCGAEYGSLKSPTPQTGDNSNIALFGGLMMLSIVAIAALLLIDRKRNLVGKYSK